MNICMIGHGMMGRWHSEALMSRDDCCLHTLVGRRPEPTQAFAAEFGYRKWTVDLAQALNDDEIAIVIIAGPSETHADMALACLAHDKNTLVEIPIAMSLADSERVVAFARQRGLTLGMVHPVRFVDEMIALRNRVRGGEEHVRQVVGRYYTHRLENVGGTGYRRSWTDNILWHHTTHLLDFAMWLVDQPVRRVSGFMPAPDPKTGTPMDVFYGVETAADQSLVFVGSYYGREQMYEVMAVTERDSYNMDMVRDTLTTGAGTRAIFHEKVYNARVARDFVAAVRDGREPFVTGESVLPAMGVLQEVQDQWDQRRGAQSIPGRPLPE
jgi:2-hydroxy-4-carboxymuconate semialdehyde hemiacetal dehydrogenase